MSPACAVCQGGQLWWARLPHQAALCAQERVLLPSSHDLNWEGREARLGMRDGDEGRGWGMGMKDEGMRRRGMGMRVGMRSRDEGWG